MATSTSAEKSLRQLMEDMGEEGSPVSVALPPEEVLSVEDENGESVVIDLPDGGAEVRLGPEEKESVEVEHGANLAEYMDEHDLRKIANDLIAAIDADKSSRADWERTYKEGLDTLGFKIEERSEPWPGACAAFHPMLSEAIVRFQAQTIGEIFPAHGPVKTAIVGTPTFEKEKQAKRVQQYLNYLILNVMDEYRPETEKMLFSLPLAGSAFRKVYFDPVLKRPTSMFVPAEDVVVNYAAPDIRTAERVTHILKMGHNDIVKRQVEGFFREAPLQRPTFESREIQEKIDELVGKRHTTTLEGDDRHTIYEVHTELDLVGFEDPMGIALPYVITIDKYSREVLAIRRNWHEDDITRTRRQHFVHYEFIPGLGFYGFGLTHLIGGLATASTSLLRQLVDAGTLANLPGGLKTRGLRMTQDDAPILPGEWRDVDVPSGTIKDNLFPIPYKEPSGTLYQLLGQIVEDGRRFASMADLKVADMNQQAPVGTTLAIMERAMKVQSSISARIHAGLKTEFRMLAEVVSTQTEPRYPYETEEGEEIKAADFDERIDVIPVSDPNASTLAQRVMQYQAVLQLSSHAPQIYDQKALHRQVIEVLGVANPEKIVPMVEEILPTDPITENANILNLTPVEAKEHQDHDAHLRVHRILLQDPQIAEQLQNSQSGPAVMAALDSHVREHLALLYRRQVEKELGTPLPPLGEPIPADIEKRLSTLTADAAETLLGKKIAEAQAAENAAIQQDPIIQQKERELDIREQEVLRKMQSDMSKAQLEARKQEIDRELKLIEIAQRREAEGLDAAVELTVEGMRQELEGVRLGKEIGETLDDQDIKRQAAKSKQTPSRG